jgi:MoxR-like ATPase
LRLRDTAREVAISGAVQDYAIRLVMATQPITSHAHEKTKRFLRYGASPRGAQALIVGGKIKALFNGRQEVRCEDIRAVALPALRHRIILNFEGEAGRVDPDSIIESILNDTPERC